MKVHPLTPDRWSDFEQLFGESGAYGGCWCMWWRIKRKQFDAQQGDGNRRAMQELVRSGEVPGILLYDDGEAVAWCSIAPREQFPTLDRSPVLRRVDDRPVWSLVCLYVDPRHRGQGVARRAVRAAVDYAREQGATVVEAYPTAPRGRRLPPVSSYMGTPKLFDEAGFVECARPSRSKVVLRYEIE